MPKFKSIKTLRKLCLRSIFSNMDTLWCANYRENYMEKNSPRFSFIEGPFNELDTSSVRKLLKMLVKHKKMSKVYLHLLIIPTLNEIDLSGAAKYVTDDIIGLICTRCRGLSRVELTHCDRVSSKSLELIVEKFHKTLMKICLTGTKLNDRVLELIGATCSNLIYLDVSMTKFTVEAMKKLVYSDEKYTLSAVGKSLQVLKMMGSNFEGDIKFLSLFLSHCKTIRCITHFSIWKSIAMLCQTPNPPALSLTGVRYDMTLDLWSLEEHEDIIPHIPKCLPEIQHLSIYDVEGMDMHLFHFISGCGKTLRSLKMDWAFPYDFLPFIGLLCPQLDTLMLSLSDIPRSESCFCDTRRDFENFISDNGIRSKNKKPWSKLSQLIIYWSPPDSQAPPMSASPILLDIFKAAASTLSFVNLHWMPDRNIDDLLTRCLNEKYFENLSQLFLHGNPFLTVDTMWDIVLKAPLLKHIDFSGCPLINYVDYSAMSRYVAENNYALTVECEIY